MTPTPFDTDPDEMGEIIAEFNDRADAELFAQAKAGGTGGGGQPPTRGPTPEGRLRLALEALRDLGVRHDTAPTQAEPWPVERWYEYLESIDKHVRAVARYALEEADALRAHVAAADPARRQQTPPDALKPGDRVRLDRSWCSGTLLDIYDDRIGDPVVWRVQLLTGEIVMEQSNRLRTLTPDGDAPPRPPQGRAEPPDAGNTHSPYYPPLCPKCGSNGHVTGEPSWTCSTCRVTWGPPRPPQGRQSQEHGSEAADAAPAARTEADRERMLNKVNAKLAEAYLTERADRRDAADAPPRPPQGRQPHDPQVGDVTGYAPIRFDPSIVFGPGAGVLGRAPHGALAGNDPHPPAPSSRAADIEAETPITAGVAPAPTPAPTLTAAEEAALNRAIKQLNNLSCGTVLVLIRLRDRLLAAGAPTASTAQKLREALEPFGQLHALLKLYEGPPCNNPPWPDSYVVRRFDHGDSEFVLTMGHLRAAADALAADAAPAAEGASE